MHFFISCKHDKSNISSFLIQQKTTLCKKKKVRQLKMNYINIESEKNYFMQLLLKDYQESVTISNYKLSVGFLNKSILLNNPNFL